MYLASTPACAIATTFASGFKPWLLANSWLPNNTQAAPSFTPEALPAVTEPPSLRKGAFKAAKVSNVVSARGCSSVSMVMLFFLRS